MIPTTKTIKFHPFNKQKVFAKLTIRDKINTCNLFFLLSAALRAYEIEVNLRRCSQNYAHLH